MTTDRTASHGRSSSGQRTARGSEHLWLTLLRLSALVAGVAVILTGLLIWVLHGLLAAGSVLAGGALVMVFFGISLLAGHLVGRNNPSGAVGVMTGLYFVKVIVFGVVFFILKPPAWLEGQFFVMGAVVGVIAWQVGELYGFSKARLAIYNDPAEAVQSSAAEQSNQQREGQK